MVAVFIDGDRYRVRPEVAGEFLISLRPHRPVEDWKVWQEAQPEDIDAGWDRPLALKGGERFYTTPKYITASAPSPEQLLDEARVPRSVRDELRAAAVEWERTRQECMPCEREFFDFLCNWLEQARAAASPNPIDGQRGPDLGVPRDVAARAAKAGETEPPDWYAGRPKRGGPGR